MQRFLTLLSTILFITVFNTNTFSQTIVKITNNPTLGNILTDGNGRSLYFFTKDATGSSLCNDGCTVIWPVFYSNSLIIGEGLNTNDFGTILRADSSKQTTYKGWPLYYFHNDSIAGDVKGENVNGVWYVAKPDYSIMLMNNQLVGHNSISYNSNYQPGEEVIQYFVDDYGRTLYTFTKDTFNNNNFTAQDFSNNKVWPIYEEELGSVPSIIDTTLFSIIDVFGRKQLTYKGWPLYYFGRDSLMRGYNKGISFPSPGVWPVAKTNIGIPTGVEVFNPEIPVGFSLNQNFPNPFNPSTTITYSIPSGGFVTIKIYDILGNEILTLVNEEQNAGNYSVLFDASGLASGMYLYKLSLGNFEQAKKFVLLK
ncbi:MAG: hypothetical protein FD188_2443 [Ignavibacteria bacterium]|nr:MAG: hypothetical protein FD188_2443 [Ignavibacteria bacterium]